MPTNQQLIKFMETYGLSLLLLIVVISVGSKFAISLYDSTQDNTINYNKEIPHLEQGDIVSYNGGTYVVSDTYGYSWGEVEIELNKR